MEYQIIFSLVLILLAFASILSKSASITEPIIEDNAEIHAMNASMLEPEQEEA